MVAGAIDIPQRPATQAQGTQDSSDIDAVHVAVTAARAAQPGWEALGFEGRARYMQSVLALLIENQEAYLDIFREETGRSDAESTMLEILPTADSLAYYSKRAKKLLADERPSLHLLKMKKVVIRHRPLGVIGIITPWNAPFTLGSDAVVQALMAGNSVVLKPSEVTPRSGGLIGELFAEAGLPEGVLSVVQGDGRVGAALVDAGVDKISFTGSVKTGRKVGEACGRNLISCTLELGGNDACIVCADAPLTRAASGVVFGAFMNSGQACLGVERVYVVDEVADEFIERTVDVVRQLRLGSVGQYDQGRMIWEPQLAIIERHVADAIARGAKLLVGGKRSEEHGPLFYEPTVLTDVTHEMAIMREETFGPVLAIMRVGSEGEALELANDSQYGLSGTIWTRDKRRALELAKGMDTGSVCINDSSVTPGIHEIPFGGRKQSGLGHNHGPDGLKGFCFPQPVVLDRFVLDSEMVWYPHAADTKDKLQGAVKWLFGSRLGRRLL